MTRQNQRTIARLALTGLTTYAICAMWPGAPVIGTLVDCTVRADMLAGLALGAILVTR